MENATLREWEHEDWQGARFVDEHGGIGSRAHLLGLTIRRGRPCPACGHEVGLLEERHVVDGSVFHTVCVPA